MTRPIIVEQLNHAQWCASCPAGPWRSSGVGSYVDAVADALWMAEGRHLAVETVGLDGSRATLLRRVIQ